MSEQFQASIDVNVEFDEAKAQRRLQNAMKNIENQLKPVALKGGGNFTQLEAQAQATANKIQKSFTGAFNKAAQAAQAGQDGLNKVAKEAQKVATEAGKISSPLDKAATSAAKILQQFAGVANGIGQAAQQAGSLSGSLTGVTRALTAIGGGTALGGLLIAITNAKNAVAGIGGSGAGSSGAFGTLTKGAIAAEAAMGALAIGGVLAGKKIFAEFRKVDAETQALIDNIRQLIAAEEKAAAATDKLAAGKRHLAIAKGEQAALQEEVDRRSPTSKGSPLRAVEKQLAASFSGPEQFKAFQESLAKVDVSRPASTLATRFFSAFRTKIKSESGGISFDFVDKIGSSVKGASGKLADIGKTLTSKIGGGFQKTFGQGEGSLLKGLTSKLDGLAESAGGAEGALGGLGAAFGPVLEGASAALLALDPVVLVLVAVTAAAAIATIAINKIAQAIVKQAQAASDLNESNNAIAVQLGALSGQYGLQTKGLNDVANGYFAATKNAAAYGLTQQSLNQALVPTVALLRANGLAAKDAAVGAEELTARAVDLASVYNVDVNEALTAINAGLRGEGEPLRRFGVNLTEQAVNAKAAALGFKKLNGQYSENGKAAARYSLIIEQTNQNQGDFAKTLGGSLANQQRVFAATLADTKTQISAQFLPAALQIQSALTDLAVHVGPLVVGFFKSLKPAIDAVGLTFQIVVGTISRFAEVTKAAFDLIIEKTSGVSHAVGGFFKDLRNAPILGPILGGVAKGFDFVTGATEKAGEAQDFYNAKLDAGAAFMDQLDPIAGTWIESLNGIAQAAADAATNQQALNSTFGSNSLLSLDANSKLLDQFQKFGQQIIAPLDPFKQAVASGQAAKDAAQRVKDIEQQIADLKKTQLTLAQQNTAKAIEEAEANEKIRSIKAQIVDLEEQKARAKRDEDERLAREVDDQQSLADKILQNTIDQAKAKRDVTAAEAALNAITTKTSKTESFNVQLAGLSLSQIQARLAAVRLTLSAQKQGQTADTGSTDATKTKVELQETLTEAQIAQREAEREGHALSVQKADILVDQAQAAKDYGQTVAENGAREAELNRGLDAAVKDRIKLQKDEIGVKADQKKITVELKKLEDSRADAADKAKNAQIEFEGATALAKGDIKTFVDKQVDLLLNQEKGITKQDIFNGKLQTTVDLINQQVEAVTKLQNGDFKAAAEVILKVNGLLGSDNTALLSQERDPNSLLNALLKPGSPFREAILQILAQRFPGFATGGVIEKAATPFGNIIRVSETGREAVLPLTSHFDMQRVLKDERVLNPILAALPRIKLPTPSLQQTVNQAFTRFAVPPPSMTAPIPAGSTLTLPKTQKDFQSASDRRKEQRDHYENTKQAVKAGMLEALKEADIENGEIHIQLQGSTYTELDARALARRIQQQQRRRI